ncbi:hypothetical protein AB0M28_22255 [Streptomyces sp. NPDC051940]|uniref:hypothetical protein n=1 Tax=Streptomyces sp. NPDC051940 TaxID=3155675 RepID=UPI003418EBCE
MTVHPALPGLASNPAAPAGVLLRLLTLDDREIRQRFTWRRSLPDEVAEAVLTHPDRRLRLSLAESWTVAPELRARLLDDPEPRMALAVAMGPLPYRTEVPPLPDWAYDRLLNHEKDIVRYEAAGAPTTPPHVLVPLARHDDPYFRRTACRRAWHLLGDDERAVLLDDPDATVRESAALHVMHEDEERTAQLLESLEPGWDRQLVLERGRLTRGVAERLLAEESHLPPLLRNPTFPADLAASLAGHDDPAVRLAVSARPRLTEEERAAIDWQVRPEDRLDTLWWVWTARDDADVLRRCAASAHTWLRRSAAVCEELPDDCVELLAADEDFAVRLLLAERHPKAPPELLLDLYVHGTHRAVGMLTTRPGFPAAGLAERFADAADPRCRALAVRDPAATPALLDRLSRDPDPWVRDAAARDPRLPADRITELLDAPGTGPAAAANPALPAAAMTALLDRAGVGRPPLDRTGVPRPAPLDRAAVARPPQPTSD